MNRKIKNSNGYTLGGRSKWHDFLDTISKCAIGLGIIAAITIIMFIVTLSFWA